MVRALWVVERPNTAKDLAWLTLQQEFGEARYVCATVAGVPGNLESVAGLMAGAMQSFDPERDAVLYAGPVPLSLLLVMEAVARAQQQQAPFIRVLMWSPKYQQARLIHLPTFARRTHGIEEETRTDGR